MGFEKHRATSAGNTTRRAFVGTAALAGTLVAGASMFAAAGGPAKAHADEVASAETSGSSADQAPAVTSEPFVAASLQFNPLMYELDANIDALCDVLGQLFDQTGARLVVAPEMCTTGYGYTSRADIEPYVDTIPGKATEAVGELCAEHGAYVVFGMAERDEETDIYYNAAVLVGPDGVVGKYRKTHQWETEEHWAAWGDLGFPVFDTDLGRIGINICMDAAYMESARCLAVAGANILCFPTNSSAQAIAALPARAMQNGMYVVSGNRSNTENGFHMIGGSAIWSPEGELLAQAPLVMTSDEDIDEAAWYTAQIDPALYDNDNRARMAGRRPELYQNLLLHIGPWDYTASTDSAHVTAAALQYTPADTLEATAEKIRSLVLGLGTSPDLVVLPELALTGLVGEGAVADNSAETLSLAAELAKACGAAVVIGGIEGQDGKLYNSAFVVGSDGALVGTYRKTHLGEADAWATPGDDIPVFEVEGIGRVGVLIGDDVCFPEAAGALAVGRADVICNPAAWHGQYGGFVQTPKEMSASPFADNAMVLWDAVSEGAEAYTVTANFVGGDAGYLGSSALNTLDPLYASDVQSCAGKDDEEAFVAEFDTLLKDGWYNQQKLVDSRRTDYYKPLVARG